MSGKHVCVCVCVNWCSMHDSKHSLTPFACSPNRQDFKYCEHSIMCRSWEILHEILRLLLLQLLPVIIHIMTKVNRREIRWKVSSCWSDKFPGESSRHKRVHTLTEEFGGSLTRLSFPDSKRWPAIDPRALSRMTSLCLTVMWPLHSWDQYTGMSQLGQSAAHVYSCVCWAHKGWALFAVYTQMDINFTLLALEGCCIKSPG